MDISWIDKIPSGNYAHKDWFRNVRPHHLSPILELQIVRWRSEDVISKEKEIIFSNNNYALKQNDKE